MPFLYFLMMSSKPTKNDQDIEMYPNIEEYKHAIRNIQNRLFSQSFQYVPSPSDTNELYFCSGNFSVVFRVKDNNGKHFALKCFTIEKKDRLSRYQAISTYLDQYQSDYFVAYEYLEKELFVTSISAGDKDFPILKMEWVHGNTLAIALNEACNNHDIDFLKNICEEWDNLCIFLLDNSIAHGDLKHDNIVVTDNNKLVLIDYDGMFVPALKNMDANEIGSSAYQHPKRNHSIFNKDMDHFSILVIKLSLHALKHNPALFKQYHTGENIIFSKKDFDNFENSPLVGEIKKLNHPYLNKLLQDLKQSCSSENITISNIHQILESSEKIKWMRPNIIIISFLVLIIICVYIAIRDENEPNEIITKTVNTQEVQKTRIVKAENKKPKSITTDTYQIPFEQYIKFEKDKLLFIFNVWKHALLEMNIEKLNTMYANSFDFDKQLKKDGVNSDTIEKIKNQSLQVQIDNPVITIESYQNASIHFEQVIIINSHQIQARKELQLKKIPNGWVIQNEKVHSSKTVPRYMLDKFGFPVGVHHQYCSNNYDYSVKDYKRNLVNISGRYTKDNKPRKINSETKQQYLAMRKAANIDGINLVIVSAYRSYNLQRNLKNNPKYSDKAAFPGYSEHHLGTTIDFLYVTFADNDKNYKWLKNNAHRFGFVLTYYKGHQIKNIKPEANHWRYIGVAAAEKYYQKHFEDY